LERILDWATTSNYRQGENPARWKGHLKNLLPAVNQLVKHHAALPYDDVAGFVAALRAKDSTTARALEFTILTAARTSEVIGAKAEEFDLDKAIWAVPAERMKKKKEHHVPLSPRALRIVKEQLDAGDSYVFPGAGTDHGLSNMAMLNLLKRMGHKDLTVHGFRSTFRDWAAEQTAYPREVCEQALAHFTGDATEAAYRRGNLMDKRRRLMAAWTKHCQSPKRSAKVTSIRRKGS
jgi:integrase